MTAHAPPPDGEISAISHFVAVGRRAPAGPSARTDPRGCSGDFATWFRGTGMPDWIGTFDLVSLPYPTRFGLFRAAITPAPYLSLTHRLVVVRWHDADGGAEDAALRADRRGTRAAHPVFRAAQRVDAERARARVLATARRCADASAQRRHRRRRRRLDHVRPSAHAGRASLDRHDRAGERPLARGVRLRAALPNAKLIVQRDGARVTRSAAPAAGAVVPAATYKALRPGGDRRRSTATC